MAKRNVIYTRFTDPKQREESHEAQERKVRQHLDYLGIDHANALVLRDSALRGDLEEDRAFYDQLLGMIRQGEVALLAVDQQSRFSRGFNVRALVQDLVYVGGRFIAAEGIDTDRPGWQDMVGLKEIHNQMETDAWVREQLSDLGALLREQSPEAIQLVRAMIGRIVAEEVKIPGKKRGYVRIRFRIDGWAALVRILSTRLHVPLLLALTHPDEGQILEKFIFFLRRQVFSGEG